MRTRTGKTMFEVRARDESGFLMLLPAAFAEATAKRLRMFVLRSKVTLTDVSGEMGRYGVWGGALPPGWTRSGRKYHCLCNTCCRGFTVDSWERYR